MYEVEVKVQADHERVTERLDSLGAASLGTVIQEDTYYNAPDRDFAQTDEALRIRRERSVAGETDESDEQTRLTYKGPLVEAESKTREEAETAVDDEEALQNILRGLGYETAATVRKERERYTVDEFTVTLDSVDGLGEFVEVETETEDDIERTRERAIDVLDSLGLDSAEQIRTSYLGLLLEDASE